MNDFDLTLEPWVPVLMKSAERKRLSLRDVLVHAHEVLEISLTSPLMAASVQRLLVAFAHRLVGVTDRNSWAASWQAGRFEPNAVETYLAQWQKYLRLFDADHPFMQDPRLPLASVQSLSRLAHDRSPTNNNEFLDHPHTDPGFRPDEALLLLLTHQAFSLGGLIAGRLPGEPTAARAAPLAKAAIVIVRGDDLFRTLMLNLTRATGPMAAGDVHDCPAWERDGPPEGVVRDASGVLDLLTWQSRRVLLRPEDGDGGTTVRQVISKRGDELPAGWKTWEVEPMVAYVAVKKPKPGGDPWVPLGLREDRMAWRDSSALFQATTDSADQDSRRPATLTWLAELTEAGVLARSERFRLDVYGLGGYQSKIEFWRKERLPLPLAIVGNRDRLAEVRSALDAAERVANHLTFSMRRLATLLVAPESDQSGAPLPDPGRVRQTASGFGATEDYWNRLEAGFMAFIDDLAGDEVETAALNWRRRLRDEARHAATRVFDSLDSSARALKAMTNASRHFYGGLKRALSMSEDAA